MNLALAILFLWLGAALLTVAFHPVNVYSSHGAVGDVVRNLSDRVRQSTSAYAAE